MNAKATSAGQVRRVLRLLFVLQGHGFNGLRLKQVAERLNANPSTAYRDLEVLADEGIAERVPGQEDCWRLTPKLIQLAFAHQDETSRLEQRVSDFHRRYTRQS